MFLKKLTNKTTNFIVAHPRLFSNAVGFGITFAVSMALSMTIDNLLNQHQAFAEKVILLGDSGSTRGRQVAPSWCGC